MSESIPRSLVLCGGLEFILESKRSWSNVMVVVTPIAFVCVCDVICRNIVVFFLLI